MNASEDSKYYLIAQIPSEEPEYYLVPQITFLNHSWDFESP